MTRLPTVGGDGNAWGTLLNSFLQVAHNADGSLISQKQYMYLPYGWDNAWQAAKANVATQQVRVVGIGDSITQGWGSTDFMIDSWWAKLRAALLTANGNALGGDHYGLLYSAAFDTATSGPTTATPPLVFGGTYNTSYGPNPSGYNYLAYNNVALTPYLTCTPPYNVTGFDIVYVDVSTGSWTYQVDSGSTITVNTTGPGTAAGSIVKKVSITGLSAGTHTLKINCTSTSTTCNILGITAYASTSTGLAFGNMGYPGMGLVTGSSANNALADTGQFPPDRLALYQGYQGTTASPTALSGFGFPAAPDLAIIAMGVNDGFQGVSRANFRDALDRLVWSIRYGKADAASIIIVAMWGPDGTAASSTAVTNLDYSSTMETPYRDIRAAMLEVAQNEQCAFVDVHGFFGRKAVTNGWITSVSNIHPTPAGHLKIAQLFEAIL